MSEVADLVLDAETLEHPHEYLDRLREEQPVFFSASLNAYVITRYADCQYVLNNPGVFSSSPPPAATNLMAVFSSAYTYIYEQLGVPVNIPTLVVTDGTVHRRYRNAVDKAFNASSVAALEPEILTLVDALIDEFIDAGKTDIYRSFCMKLPLFVICDMLGLPRDVAPLLQRSADAQARLAAAAQETPESIIRLHRDQAEFNKYLQPLLRKLREAPDGSLISRLIHTPTDDGSFLSEAELISMITTLNVGGNETTTNGLGNMFWLCFRDPELQQRLRDDRSLIERFVEEALRLESPVATMARWVTRDAEINGVHVPAGSALMVSFNAANRDPRRFGCPFDLDLERKGARNHVAFGMGVHYCLGAMLSRAELKIAMNRLLDRLGDIRIDNHGEELRHQYKVIVRGLTQLPIIFKKLS